MDGKKARSVAKAQFSRAERCLSDALMNEADVWTVEKRYDDLKVRWDKAQDAHDAFVVTLEDDGDAQTQAAWIDELTDRFSKIELAVGKIVVKKKSEETTDDFNVLLSESSVDNTPKTQQCGIKMERMKFDIFKGDIRKYPDFKSEFIKYIQPRCQVEQLAFILKGYLDDSVKEEVNNVGNDYAEMWSRLDMKYGNIGKLVDAILYDVKRLSSKSDNWSEVLKMINTIEKAWRDLKSLGQSSELYNSTTISIIEQAMTQQMKMEWVKMIASKEGCDSQQKFHRLLDFFKDWRNRIEYSSAEIREEELPSRVRDGGVVHQVAVKRNSVRRQRCWFHNIDGPNGEHPIWRCRLFQSKSVAERMNLVSANNACTRCLLTGCPGATNAAECQRAFMCSICKGKHNALLHEEAAGVHHNYNEDNYGFMNPLLPLQEMEASS